MYFENLGINLVVNDLNFKENTSLKNLNLSEIGQKVYSQLNYIKNFKLYEYRSILENESNRTKVINELYNSLYRFKHIKVLPKKNLAGLYPIFKKSKVESIYLIRGTILNTFNKELYELINIYQGTKDDSFSKDEKEKLNFSISRIIMSGLYSLGKVEKPDSWGSYNAKEQIDLLSKVDYDNDCDCIDCTLNDYNYSSALNKIYLYNINEKTKIWDDLIYAYGLYRIRDFYNCYLAYSNIITKANRLNYFEVSFISKYNLKRLRWIIRNDFHNDRLEWEDIEGIRSKIDDISLDNELDKLKYFSDKDVYNFLKEIKDGVYIQRLCNQIDEIFIKVPKTIESVKNGGMHSSDVFNSLYRTVQELKSFLSSNFLIGNGFSPVEHTLGKSINTFVLGYYLKSFAEIKKHSLFGLPHIVEFDTFMFKLIIEDSNNKELVEILEKNEINNIKISKESLGKIFNYINNFLKSSFKISRRFGNSINKNKSFTSSVIQNASFKSYLNKKFNSLCIVIAYFDFSKEQIKIMYSNLNYYIDFMSFNNDEFKYLKNILFKKAKYLEEKELIKTLNIFDNKKAFNISYIKILELLKKKNRQFTHDAFFTKDFDINKFTYDFPILYKVLNREKKKEFKTLIQKKAELKDDAQFIYLAISKKIINTKKIKSNYKELINNLLNIKLENQERNRDHFRFRVKQFFSLVNRNLVDLDTISKESITEEEFHFLLNPEKYNPNKFKLEWLDYYNWDCYCKRFSKIEYISHALEKHLKEEYDENLSKVYFKIKKHT